MIQGKQLKALLRTLRDQGVVSFKHEGLEILLDPNFQPQASKAPLKSKSQVLHEQVNAMTAPVALPELSDEQWLLATNMQDPDENEIVPN